MTVTAVLTLTEVERGKSYMLNIIPEVCSPKEAGVNIIISQDEAEAIMLLDFDQE